MTRVRASGAVARPAQARRGCAVAWSRQRGVPVRSKNTYLTAQYHRLAARRGDKRAIVAVAHSIVVIVYHVLTRKEPYRELGGDYFERRNPEARAKRLARQIEKLGYTVTLATGGVAA